MPYLGEIVAILVVSVAIAYVCRRLRVVPIVGFIVAGILIGPHSLALVPDQELVDTLAEIGVILLLFTIGVELSLGKLSRIRRFVVVGGSLQATALIVIVLGLLVGVGIEWRVALFTAFLVVLSSTAIVLKLLSDRGSVDTPAGQITIALLVFQDLAMVGMVLLVPALSGEGSVFAIAWAVLKAAAIVGLVLLLASKTIPWLLEKVAETRGQDLFLLTVVAICFGTAWITNLVGVSLALGAFLAGLVVSESKYRGYALSEVLPLRTVFSAVFFVSIGMLLDVRFVVENILMVTGTAVFIFVVKSAVTAGTVVALGYPVRIAAVSGLALAQICETSFVLERVGAAAGMSPAGLGFVGQQTFIAVLVILMIATPFAVQAGPRIGAFLEATLSGRLGMRTVETPALAEISLENHVVVVGFGPAGRALVGAMRDAHIPYLVIELNPETGAELEAASESFVYGDATRPQTLDAAGIARAKVCVVVVNDPSAAARVVELAHFANPTLEIFVRSRYMSDAFELEEMGASRVVSDETETSVRLISEVLRSYAMPGPFVQRHRVEIGARSEVTRPTHPSIGSVPASAAPQLEMRTVIVQDEALAAHAKLDDLALHRSHGLTVVAVQRGNDVMRDPAATFVVRPGDRLVIKGAAKDFVASAHLFRRPRA